MTHVALHKMIPMSSMQWEILTLGKRKRALASDLCLLSARYPEFRYWNCIGNNRKLAPGMFIAPHMKQTHTYNTHCYMVLLQTKTLKGTFTAIQLNTALHWTVQSNTSGTARNSTVYLAIIKMKGKTYHSCKILIHSIIKHCALFWHLTCLETHGCIIQTGPPGPYRNSISSSHQYLWQHTNTDLKQSPH